MTSYTDPATLPSLHVVDVVAIARQASGLTAPPGTVGWCAHESRAYTPSSTVSACVCGSEEVAYLAVADAINWLNAQIAALRQPHKQDPAVTDRPGSLEYAEQQAVAAGDLEHETEEETR